MSQPVGIDFGTTNSVVAAFSGGAAQALDIDDAPPAWRELGFDRVFPSVLGVVDGTRMTFGWAAKQQRGDKLEAVKRLFASEESVKVGGQQISVELAAAALFGRLRAGAEGRGATITRAVITIPANSRGLARSRTKICAGLAGIEVAALINEPTAAAMAHSISARDDQTILVFDWGGGTLDVTVLETIAGVFMERASKGIQRSGGIDLDNLLARSLLPRVDRQAGWTAGQRALFRLEVELAKVRLSNADETNIQLPTSGYLTVTRADLENAIAEKVAETRDPIEQCMRDLRISPSAIDHVVMVGGSSKIPAVRRLVAELLGREPSSGVDPMTAVAEGAAIAAAILAGQLDSDFFVGTEHALGTMVMNDERRLAFSTLIPRNHSLPAKATRSYSPANEGQGSVLVRVIEGDPDVDLEHPDNVVLKEWEVPIDETRPQAEAGFDIVYSYDVDGILHVSVIDQKTGMELLKDDVTFGPAGDKAGLVRTAAELRKVLETGLLEGQDVSDQTTVTRTVRTDPESAAVVARVRTKIIPFVDDAEAKRLEALCLDTENAPADVAPTCRAALEASARQYAYLY